jgi:hypothetical protein
MRTLIYSILFLCYLLIPQNFAPATNINEIYDYKIYDVYHRQKYNVNIDDNFSGKVLLKLLNKEEILVNITIYDWYVSNTKILNETFLLMSLTRPVGSGVGVEITKLFSVKDGKLFESIFLRTSYNSTSTFPVEKERYMTTFTLIGKTYEDFSLNIKESYFLHSEIEKPPKNVQWTESFIIPFNPQEMIFANDQTVLNGEFTFKNRKPSEQRLLTNKSVKKLTLRDQQYLSIDSKWYLQEGRTLTER